jgi:hypothetical protein
MSETSISTFKLPAHLEHDVPAVPDLDDPRAYAIWRDECLTTRRIPREAVAEVLESFGTDIACFRAAINLSHNPLHRDWQKRVMVKAFAGRRVVYLLTKCLEANIVAHQGYGVEPQFDILASSMMVVIQRVLEEVRATQERTALHLELEVRANLSLGEAMAVAEHYDAALQHASEVILLAPHVGLDNLVMSSKYLIADIQFRRGNLQIAQHLIEEVIGSPNAPLVLVEAARFYRAEFQYWMGDESACQATLNAFESQLREDSWWLEPFMLRQNNINSSDMASLASRNGLAHTLVKFSSRLMELQDLAPEREVQIQALYKKMARDLRQEQSVFSKGWFMPYGRALEAYALLRSKPLNVFDTFEILPTVEALQSMPSAARTLTAAIMIEVSLTCLLQFTANSTRSKAVALLDQAFSDLRSTLATLEDSVCDQIARKLQLLCPTTLALVSVCVNAPRIVHDLGTEAIMNLHQRPIRVYGSPGLRPVHAARMTLEAFGRNDVLLFSRGGGQVREMRTVLQRLYFQRRCWFTPVAPAVLLFAFLTLRDVAQHNQPMNFRTYQLAAENIYSNFGITPRLQQTERIEQLNQLEEVLVTGLNEPLRNADLTQAIFD